MQKLIYRNEKGQELILSNSRPFYLSSIENTASSNTSITTSSRDHGFNVDNISIKEKIIPVIGGIEGFNKDDLNRKRVYLTKVLNPLLKGELIYSNENITRKIDVYIESTAFKTPIANLQEFLIQFTAPIPFWKDLNTLKTEIALWESNFSFELEIENNGINLGNRVSNLICNINNSGDVKCGMKIQFRSLATVVNPKLINVNTREFIKINKVLQAGDLVEVTTEYANKRIELVNNNGTRENIYHWIDLESEFLELDLGDNLFRYDADEGLDNLEVAIYHTPLYLGV